MTKTTGWISPNSVTDIGPVDPNSDWTSNGSPNFFSSPPTDVDTSRFLNFSLSSDSTELAPPEGESSPVLRFRFTQANLQAAMLAAGATAADQLIGVEAQFRVSSEPDERIAVAPAETPYPDGQNMDQLGVTDITQATRIYGSPSSILAGFPASTYALVSGDTDLNLRMFFIGDFEGEYGGGQFEVRIYAVRLRFTFLSASSAGGGISVTTSCLPNRARGARTSVILGEESCWGTAATGQAFRGLDFTSESLRNDINNIESQIIRSDRTRAAPQLGNKRPGGDINGELQPGTWSILAKHAIGNVDNTTGSNPYTHLILPEVDLLDGLTLEKRFNFRTGTSKILRYLGGRVNEFFVSIPTEGIVTARASLLFKEEREVSSPLTESPVYLADNEPFSSFQGTVYLNGDPISTVTSLDFLLNNSMSGEEFALDGFDSRADLPEDQRLISGSLGAFFTEENWTLYQGYLANSTFALRFKLLRGSSYWDFTLPAIKLRGNPTPQVGGRGPINLQLAYEAFPDATSGLDVSLEIRNAEPRISTTA